GGRYGYRACHPLSATALRQTARDSGRMSRAGRQRAHAGAEVQGEPRDVAAELSAIATHRPGTSALGEFDVAAGTHRRAVRLRRRVLVSQAVRTPGWYDIARVPAPVRKRLTLQGCRAKARPTAH